MRGQLIDHVNAPLSKNECSGSVRLPIVHEHIPDGIGLQPGIGGEKARLQR